MKGRWLFWVVAPLLAAALVLQVRRGLDRIEASKVLKTVQAATQLELAQGARRRPAVFRHHLDLLEPLGRMDPVEVQIPITRGVQHEILGHREQALEAFREALRLEPRPVVYLHLAWVQEDVDPAAAAAAREKAFRLAPLLKYQERQIRGGGSSRSRGQP